MKVVALSDLHGYLPDPKKFPECDVVCICGDIVPLEYQTSLVQSVAWFGLEFVPWTDTLPCKKVIFIAGNHDFFLEELGKGKTPSKVLGSLLPGNNKGQHKIVYLCDNSIEFEGKVFYGTPWCPELYRWAFYKSSEDLTKAFENIPKKPVDVFMSHAPAAMGLVGHVLENNIMANYGCVELANVLEERPNVRYAICGHVHSGMHRPEQIGPTTYVNVSIKDESYRPTYNLFSFNI